MAAAEAPIQLQIQQAVAASMAAHVAAPPPVAPVAHVAVKLPDFWVKDPKMCVALPELSVSLSFAQFAQEKV